MQHPTVKVLVTNNGPRPPEQWAEMAADKIINVSDQAPQPIRDQAYAFRKQLVRVVTNYIRMAVNENDAIWRDRVK